jgi:hypothetical protein
VIFLTNTRPDAIVTSPEAGVSIVIGTLVASFAAKQTGASKKKTIIKGKYLIRIGISFNKKEKRRHPLMQHRFLRFNCVVFYRDDFVGR